MGQMLINVEAPMVVLWAQVLFILSPLYRVLTHRQQHLVMQCHPHSIYHRMTNCSLRTGEYFSFSFNSIFIVTSYTTKKDRPCHAMLCHDDRSNKKLSYLFLLSKKNFFTCCSYSQMCALFTHDLYICAHKF